MQREKAMTQPRAFPSPRHSLGGAQGETFDLAARALGASGCRGALRRSYLERLDRLVRALERKLPGPEAGARARAEALDVENILPEGFAYQGHRAAPGRQVWGGRELLADLYVRVGNEAFDKGELEGALRCYRTARRLNPGYLVAKANCVIAQAAIRSAAARG